MEIGLQIPDDIAEDIRNANGQDIAQHILEAYAIQAYQQRELSTVQLRRLLGFETRYEFENFLAAHHVPRNYTLADLEHDRETALAASLSFDVVLAQSIALSLPALERELSSNIQAELAALALFSDMSCGISRIGPWTTRNRCAWKTLRSCRSSVHCQQQSNPC